MIDLPQKFLDEIRLLLGDEYDDFLKSYDKPMNYGLRVNTLKISPENYLKLSGENLRPVPWNELGFYYDGSRRFTKNPLYHAGLYYIQEPSAMCPAHMLPVEEGDIVLDMCAAPGGKSTALGAKLKNTGLLVSNDVSVSRAKALLKNIEFFGIKNSLILSEDPSKLAGVFPEYFDKVLIDAPCSGEGMFRKKPSMTAAWERSGPDYFGPIQRRILLNGADLLKPGGMMVYSTCTFSEYEDEGSVEYLLKHRPEMSVVKVKRLWPHKVDGEGHFCVLLKKAGEKPAPSQECYCPQSREDLTPFHDFVRAGNAEDLFDPSRLVAQKGSLYYFPKIMPEFTGLRVIRNGWYLGELKKNRFEPSGAFARALTKDQWSHVLDLSLEDPRVIKYLKCETIEGEEGQENGWYIVCAAGYPLGFGKMNRGTLKNKYPVGWRWE